MKNEKLTLVISSLDSSEKANEIAEILVNEKLAACVSIFPGVLSVYFWENKLCKETEFLLLIKTRASLFEAIKEKLLEIHPYETPEIIAIPVNDSLDKYAKWVLAETDDKKIN